MNRNREHYTAEQRMSLANAFRVAKACMMSRPRYAMYYGVCCFLNAAYNDGQITILENETAREIIRSRLEGCAYVYTWLYNQGIPWQKITHRAMYKYRLRWLDSLISEFEQKGE
jgi:hypothetical protein